jgi:hypothetical protein
MPEEKEHQKKPKKRQNLAFFAKIDQNSCKNSLECQFLNYF